MSTPLNDFDPAAFDRAIDPVVRLLTHEQVRKLADHHSDSGLQDRIEQLASKSNEGDLTAAERAELQSYVRANKLVAILQARARRLLAEMAGD
jgi:hypothetical protein